MARRCPNTGAGVPRSAAAWSCGAGLTAVAVRSCDYSCAGNGVDGGGGAIVVVVGHGAGGIGDGAAGGGCYAYDGRRCYCSKTEQRRTRCPSP